MKKAAVLYITFSFALLLSLFSCASTSGKNETLVLPVQSASGQGRSFFSSIDKTAFALACEGSPQSLRQAVSILHKTIEDDYAENEKMLIAICTSLMKILWPSESFAWETPEVPRNNPYMGAVDSALKGIYDSSTGNSDFFAKVLPSLVLVTSQTHSDYYAMSETQLTEALEFSPDSVLVNFLLAVLERRRGNFQSALEYFQKCRVKIPLNLEVQFNLAKAYYDCADYNTALSLAEGILLSHQQDSGALEICAQASYALCDMDKAESYVVRVLSLDPENLEYVLFRARILMDKSDYIRASSLLDVYSRSDISGRDYLLLRARLQRDWNKNNTAAAETLGRAIALYPDDREVLLFAAELASSANTTVNELKAREIAEQILESDKDNVQAVQILIAEMIKASQWKEAYDLSSSLVKRSDAPASAFYRHVEICLALKKHTEALNVAQNFYSSSSNDEAAQQSYIKVLVATGQRNTALQLINRLMETSNQKMKSFLHYERSFFRDSEDAALNDLRVSLTLNPRNKDALYRLYEIYYSKKDWRRAQYYLKQVVALDPSNAELLRRNTELDRLLGK